MNKRISILISILVLLALKTYSQVYPVSTLTQVTPPYPYSLSGFVDQMANKINLQVTVNDNTLSNYPVKLRMVLRSNAVTISTSASYISEPVYINGGEILTLNSSDVSDLFRMENLDFSGYSKAQYNKSGQLPDGVYQLSFEVIDYARNFNISSSVPAFIYIYVNDAPILNLPLNKKKIDFSPQQNIGFNWTFRHSPFSRPGLNPRYLFEMWEVYPDYLDPYFVVKSAQPVYTEELTGTSLNYTVMNPLLISGRTYAWRVRVTDPEDITAFKNDGYSDIAWFKYGVSCTPPELELESAGTEHINVAWNTEQLQSNFTLRYRPSNQETVKWYSANTTFLSHKIEPLRSNTEYFVEVEGNCGTQPSGYSNALTVTTNQKLDYQCGKDGSIPAIENQERLTRIVKGNFITAGDFEVEIHSVEGSNGVFNGKGFVLVPIFNFLKLEADLEDIVVNTDFQLIGGEIKTVYNLNNSLTLNLSELLGGKDGGTPEENDFKEIADIRVETGDSIISVEVINGKVTVTTTNGPQTETVGDKQIVSVTSPDGQNYVIDGSTNTVYTAGNSSGTAPVGNTKKLEKEPGATAKYKVSFSPAEQQFYGFDQPGSNTPSANYDELDFGGQKYLIPWKSVEANKFDKLMATIVGTPADSVFYSRESASMVMVAPAMESNQKQLMITGQGNKDADELYAWYTQKSSDTSKADVNYHAGSVKLISYQKQIINLCVVGVNGSVAPDAGYLQDYLNDIYKQAVVEWQVTKLDKGLTVTFDRKNQKEIDNTDADNRMDYTDEMKQVIAKMKENTTYNDNTIYLFFFDEAVNANIDGYMPLKSQYGFIFKYNSYPDEFIRTIAHELGHGPFRLRHTFSKENDFRQDSATTTNLMDYSGPQATGLYKYQWDLVHDPEGVLFAWLEEEGEGEARNRDEQFYDLLQRIRCAIASKRTKISMSFTINMLEDFYNFNEDGLDLIRASLIWKIKPTEFSTISTSLPEPKKDQFIGIVIEALNYDFGEFQILIPKSEQANFEQFMNNSDFNREYSEISKLILSNNTNQAINRLLNYSYCVYEKLSENERKVLLKALAEKFKISEEYEDLIINLIRSSLLSSDSKESQKSFIRYILNSRISPTFYSVMSDRNPKTIFECFSFGIDNMFGKDNYDAFILELAKLYNSAFSEELENAKYNNCLYFEWSRKATETLYTHDGIIDIRSLASHGYYYYCNKENYIYPGSIVLVNFSRDFSFINDGDNRYYAIPAFVLDYLIYHESNEIALDFVNKLMAVFQFTKAISAISIISDANNLEKFKIGWDILESLIDLALLSEEAKLEIKAMNGGKSFLDIWDKYKLIDATLEGKGIVTKVFDNDTFWMFVELDNAWDVLSKNPKIDKYFNKEKVTEEIGKLRNIFKDEGIVY